MIVTIYGRRCWRCPSEGPLLRRVELHGWGGDVVRTWECLRCWRPGSRLTVTVTGGGDQHG